MPKTLKKMLIMKYKLFNYKTFSWKKYAFETLSIFIAVVSAFSLNNWNQNRREDNAEKEIVKAVKWAVKNDLSTIKFNKDGYVLAKKSCSYLRDLIDNKPVNLDSVNIYYNQIFATYLFLPNKTGYEGLVSKGLDVIKDDGFRIRITYYYNYYFDQLTKLEDQSHSEQMYFDINNILLKYMEFNEKGKLSSVKQPINITEEERKKIFSYLWRIEANRDLKITIYTGLEEQITTLKEQAESILESME